MAFTDEQVAKLTAKLDASHVKERKQAGQNLSYIEGWHAIAEANRIFGFHAWNREIKALQQLGEPREVDGKWRVAYMATVRISVKPTEYNEIVRDGSGYGSGIDRDVGSAHESAIKEAETDAMKRALMTFGNPFGLALYDKRKENVEAAAPPRQQAPARQQPAGIDDARQRAVAFKDGLIADIRKSGNLDELNRLNNASATVKALAALHDRHKDLWDEVMQAVSRHETIILERAAA